MLSIIIPSRNEKFLTHTIKDILAKARGEIEVIAILDGYWITSDEIVSDKRVRYIHRGESHGMRNGINSAVAISRGEYLMKTDGHCMFADGFDVELINSCQDNYVVIPRRKRLDPNTWTLIQDGRPDIDYERLDENLQGKKDDKRAMERKNILIDDTMTFQGSCWVMKKAYFHELELMDEESYGSFWHEAQEMCLKAWLSGGRVIVNKNTWYAHWHKDRRGYSLSPEEKEKARAFMVKWKEKGWHKQIYSFDWLIQKFNGA